MFFIILDRLILTIYFCLSLGSVLSFCWRRSALKICKFILISWKWNWIFQDGTFEMEVEWIQWDTEVRKNSVKVEFERVAAAPLTPLIGSKWCFHFINNSGAPNKKGSLQTEKRGWQNAEVQNETGERTTTAHFDARIPVTSQEKKILESSRCLGSTNKIPKTNVPC